MSDSILIELVIVEPILLELQTEPVYSIGTAQAGPQGIQGLPGSSVIPDASESTKGLIMLASQGEVTTGTNLAKAVVPGTLKTELDKKAADDIQSLTLIFNNQLI